MSFIRNFFKKSSSDKMGNCNGSSAASVKTPGPVVASKPQTEDDMHRSHTDEGSDVILTHLDNNHSVVVLERLQSISRDVKSNKEKDEVIFELFATKKKQEDEVTNLKEEIQRLSDLMAVKSNFGILQDGQSRRELAAAEEKVSAMQRQNQELEVLLGDERQKGEQQTSQLREMVASREELESTLSEAQKSRDVHQEDARIMGEKAAAIEERNADLQKKFSQSQTAHDDLTHKYLDLEATHATTQQANTHLQAEIDTMVKEHDELSHKYHKLEITQQALQGEIHTIVKKYDTMVTKYDDLEVTHATTQQANTHLHGEIETMIKKSDTMVKERDHLRGEIHTLVKKNDDLSNVHQRDSVIIAVQDQQLASLIEAQMLHVIQQTEKEEATERATVNRKIKETTERCRIENKMPLAIMNANSTDIPPEALYVVAREISSRFPMVDFVGLNISVVPAPVVPRRRGGIRGGGMSGTPTQATTATGSMTSSRDRPAFCTLHLNIRREARVPEGIVPNGLACRAEVYFYDGQGDLLFFRNRDCSELLGCHGTTNGMNALLEWVGNCMTKYQQLDVATRRSKYC